jgi:hypothetical protein
MAHHVLTINCDDEDPWGGVLLTELGRLEGDGWVLCAMTTRMAPVVAPIGTPTRYVQQLVLVVHKEGAP